MTFPFQNEQAITDPLGERIDDLKLAKETGDLHRAFVSVQKLSQREVVVVMLRAGFEMSAFVHLPPVLFWRNVQSDLSAGVRPRASAVL